MLLRVVEHLRDVEPLGVVDAALPVGDRDDLRADASTSRSADTEPTLPKPCTATVRALDVEAEVLGRFAGDDHHAAAGRLAASERAAHLDRLAGHDGRRRVADVHAVGVHHPRHDLVVGVDVGRRHVLLRADGVDDLGDVAAGQRLELAPRHPRRIADDAALAAAERDVRDGALPRHPRRERGHFVERDVGVIADAALGRTERDVVLDAVAGEDLDLAVVHLDRARDGDLALGVGEDLPDARVETQQPRCAVELLEHRVEDAAACFHVTPDCGLPRLGRELEQIKVPFANTASQAAQVAAFTVSYAQF